LESDTIESPEDSELNPSVIPNSEVEKRRVFEDENRRRQIDKKIREQGKAKKEYSTAETHADPVLMLLRDLNDDIENLSDEVGRVQAQLKRLETKVDELLKSKSEQNDF
jgi:septal ring factor EnvC (AmiA/AmiB activator)